MPGLRFDHRIPGSRGRRAAVAAALLLAVLAAGALLSAGLWENEAAAQSGGGKQAPPAARAADEDPPVIVILKPRPNGVVSDQRLLVTGAVRDRSPIASVTVNDQPAAVESGKFTATVPLAAGANTIFVIATDSRGNFATARVKVTRARG